MARDWREKAVGLCQQSFSFLHIPFGPTTQLLRNFSFGKNYFLIHKDSVVAVLFLSHSKETMTYVTTNKSLTE